MRLVLSCWRASTSSSASGLLINLPDDVGFSDLDSFLDLILRSVDLVAKGGEASYVAAISASPALPQKLTSPRAFCVILHFSFFHLVDSLGMLLQLVLVFLRLLWSHMPS